MHVYTDFNLTIGPQDLVRREINDSTAFYWRGFGGYSLCLIGWWCISTPVME